MFTGIVQGLCPVLANEPLANLRRLGIDLGELASGLELGASVAVNGTCLTVAALNGQAVEFDVIQETLDHTNLGGLAAGMRVNVERSMQFGDEVGGHILSGHVSAKISVRRVHQGENERLVAFDVPPEWMKYLHHKGFVALDGASLTLATVDLQRSEITVALIPETVARTTLGTVSEGDWVNLEIDAQTQAVVDTIERMLESPEWRARLAGRLD